MKLTPLQKRVCDQVINVFETGSLTGDYSSIAIDNGGPNRIRQIIYGRGHTAEYGKLHELIRWYIDANGVFAAQLVSYVSQVGLDPLVDDETFKNLLRGAGKTDVAMRQVQDRFFDKYYYIPAITWADAKQFSSPLSALVIYDSYIQSGSVPEFLCKRFTEVPPASGGRERSWVEQYVATREDWLANHPNPVLHPMVYRTKCFRQEIARGNWDLSQLPIRIQGLEIFGDESDSLRR
jgi:chitosanase